MTEFLIFVACGIIFIVFGIGVMVGLLVSGWEAAADAAIRRKAEKL